MVNIKSCKEVGFDLSKPPYETLTTKVQQIISLNIRVYSNENHSSQKIKYGAKTPEEKHSQIQGTDKNMMTCFIQSEVTVSIFNKLR